MLPKSRNTLLKSRTWKYLNCSSFFLNYLFLLFYLQIICGKFISASFASSDFLFLLLLSRLFIYFSHCTNKTPKSDLLQSSCVCWFSSQETFSVIFKCPVIFFFFFFSGRFLIQTAYLLISLWNRMGRIAHIYTSIWLPIITCENVMSTDKTRVSFESLQGIFFGCWTLLKTIPIIHPKYLPSIEYICMGQSHHFSESDDFAHNKTSYPEM